MSRRQRDYRSYLLRLYRVREGEASRWRASLQSARGGKRLHFRSLDAMVGFLTDEGDLAEGAEEQGQGDGIDTGEERLGCSAAWPWHA
jgi:hypothetical protein